MPEKKLKKIPAGALKSFVDAGKSTTRVISKVERFVLSQPVDNSRSFDGLHPSAMVSPYWCHRASYFHLKGNHPTPEARQFKRELIFAQGHGIHATWQNWFRDMGKLYGVWECKSCFIKVWATSPEGCDACSTQGTMRYREVPVEHDALMITGHSDGWLKGFGDDLMLEIKSVGAGTFMWYDRPNWFASEQNFDAAWKNLKSPFESHVAQVQLYMKVLELSGREDVPQEAVLLYEAKPTQEVKEFIVRKDDWAIQPIIDGAQLVVDSLGKNVAPDCNVGGALKCKQCGGFNE
jgi:hypothetical protein